MILSFDKEIEEIERLCCGPGECLTDKKALEIAMVLTKVLDRGFAMGRDRAIAIVQRRAINPMPIVEEIRRPVR